MITLPKFPKSPRISTIHTMTEFPNYVRIVLRVRIEPDAVPGQIRMRHVLRRLLRNHGMVCERLEPIPDTATETSSENVPITLPNNVFCE